MIELLAVIAIIAILFVLLIPQISSSIDKARETGVLTDFRSFQTSVSGYFIEKGNSDFSLDAMNSHLDEQLKIVSNKTKEKDPYGNEYQFYIISKNVVQLTSTKDNKDILSLYIINNSDGITTVIDGFSTKTDANFGVNNHEGMVYIEVEKNKLVIVGYNGENPTVSIPDNIDGKTVIGIGQQAFSKTPNRGKNTGSVVTNLTLPNTLEFINGAAFAYNEIQNLTIPSSVKVVGDSAFHTNKLTSLSISSGVLDIEQYAFRYNQLTNVSIPSSVKNVGLYAFYNNPNLNTVSNKTTIINSELLKRFNSSPTITN